ncbi:MAG: hypothetical protein DRP09_10300 [Candidatus Thorarchaeota archaeon]|nr:MAG: hypothetical protein DRP09_10300 [Candidatus Thorarchaeota archaeon]
MSNEIILSPEDDRVINLIVKTNHNQVYRINMEFLAHHFGIGFDEVQIGVTKEILKEEYRSGRPIATPNRILHEEEVVAQKKKA